MSMTVISTTAALSMAVRWRRSPMIWAEDWLGSTCRLGFGQPRSSRRRISFAPACRGGLPGLLCRPCGAAHDRLTNLDISTGRKACGDDDPDSDGAPKRVGDTFG